MTMRTALATAAFLSTALSPRAAAAEPERPRVTMDTAAPANHGRTFEVPAGGDLQNALDAAQPGDVIVLEAGATFVGSFVLPVKRGDGWIVVRTSAPDDRLPPPGRRIGAKDAPLLATLASPDSRPALRTAPGAHHYRIVGLELTITSNVDRNYAVVQLGTFEQTSLAEVPHHLILDRVVVHGRADANVRRGVALNSAWTAVIDSRIFEIHEESADAQALGGSTGPGPFKIVNNLIEGSGENVMFGGADPAIPNLVPSDIEFRGNHVVKPVAWRNAAWSVKNLFELKNARRVLIDGNLFEHNWPAGQNGFAILFTVRNQDGGAPWSVVEDVTFTNNVVRQVSSAINILGHDDANPSGPARRIAIRNNLFDEIGKPPWGGRGAFLQLVDGTTDVVVENNTVAQTGEIVLVSGRPHAGFILRGNVAPHNEYGIAGDDHFGDPMGTIATYLPGSIVTGNMIAGGAKGKYPAGNAFRGAPRPTAGADTTSLGPALAAADR